jgi:hypothetical protein
LNDATKNNPQHEKSYELKGKIYRYFLNNSLAAVKECDEVIRINPYNKSAY